MILNKDWKTYYLETIKIGERLERIAESLNFDVIISPYACEPGLVHTLKEVTIQEFAKTVKILSKQFGIPNNVGESPVDGENSAPDLWALWECLDGEFKYKIKVVTQKAQCKYDPRSEYKPSYYRDGKYRTLHPECKNILEELKELDTETIKNA